MRILNSKDWAFVGTSEDGFVFKNIKYTTVVEKLIISNVGFDVSGTRIYFDFIDGYHKVRIPKRSNTSSLISTLFNDNMRDLIETDTSYHLNVVG